MYKGYIYRHWIVNDEGIEKNYIGQTIEKTVQNRWKNGNGYTRHGDTKFARAIRKYGWDNFSHEIIGIIESDTKEQLVLDLNEWEIYYIEKYDSFYNGYNSTTGGGCYIQSEETRRKKSEAFMGEKNPMYGKKHTEEQKQKISEAMSGEKNPMHGKKHTEEVKRQHSERMKGRKASEETKQKLSEAHKGKNHPLYGKQHNKQSKQKMSEARGGKRIICLNTLEVFSSAGSACKFGGIKGGVVNCCKGKYDYAGKHPITGEKLRWMYYEDYLKQLNKNNEDLVINIA